MQAEHCKWFDVAERYRRGMKNDRPETAPLSIHVAHKKPRRLSKSVSWLTNIELFSLIFIREKEKKILQKRKCLPTLNSFSF